MHTLPSSTAVAAGRLSVPPAALTDPLSTDDYLYALREGDVRVFEILFKQHFAPLVRITTRMVGSRHIAAELVQDLFLRIWSERAHLNIRGDLPSYMRRSVRNRALDWLRRERRLREWEQSGALGWCELEFDSSMLEDDCSIEHEAVLAECLATMPERRQVVCALRWREGLGPTVIAARFGLSVKTVEAHLTRGVRDLRHRLLSAAR